MSKFTLFFLSIYLFGIYWSIRKDPIWGLYLYILVYFLNPEMRWWYSELLDLRYSLVISVAIVVGFLARYSQYSASQLTKNPLTKWLIAMLALTAAGYFYAAWPEQHWYYLIYKFKLLICIAIAYKIIDTPLKFEGLIWTYLVGNAYIGWIGHSLGRNSGARLEGIGPADTAGANDTSAILITAIPLLLFYILKGKNWQKIISCIFLAFTLDTIILSNSRGAFLGLTIAFLYFSIPFWTAGGAFKKDRLKLLGILLFAISAFFYLADDTFFLRMQTLGADNAAGGAARIYYWLKTFDLVKVHPFGVGIFGYQMLSPTFLPAEMLTEGMRAVHSTYFEALAEYGYIGLVILVGYILATLRIARRTQKATKMNNAYVYLNSIALTSSFLAFLVAVAFIDRLHAETIYWIPLFISLQYKVYVTSCDIKN